MNDIEYRLGKDLQQNSDRDITFRNNDIVVTRNYDGIKQKLRNKLLSFPKSLFVDPNWGGFFQKNVSNNITSDLVAKFKDAGKNELLEEPEVDEVLTFDVDVRPEVARIIVTAKIKYRGDQYIDRLDQVIRTG